MSETPENKLCFVVGPIGEPGSEPRIHADWLLEGIIRPVMKEFHQFVVKRADHDARPGLIDVHMINDILNAELVIADLSFLNANAFYEIGIRHMIQKPIIHMQLATERIPFDVSQYRAIKFARTEFLDVENAKLELTKSVKAVLELNYETVNPVTHAIGRRKLELEASPEIQVIFQENEQLKSRLKIVEDRVQQLTDSLIPMSDAHILPTALLKHGDRGAMHFRGGMVSPDAAHSAEAWFPRALP